MRTVEEHKVRQVSHLNLPVVIIDESLNKYDDVLFPEKLAEAHESVRIAGHPEDALKRLIRNNSFPKRK